MEEKRQNILLDVKKKFIQMAKLPLEILEVQNSQNIIKLGSVRCKFNIYACIIYAQWLILSTPINILFIYMNTIYIERITLTILLFCIKTY